MEDLTRQLASKLTISKPKEKQRATPDSPPQGDSNTRMRAVNVASQKLSALMQTGWSATKDDGTSKQRREAASCALNIRKNLNALRKAVAPSPLDLERAALSAAGKLLSLQLVRIRRPCICYQPLIRRSLSKLWIYSSTCTDPYSRAMHTTLIPYIRRYHQRPPQEDCSPANTYSTFPFLPPLLMRSL